MKETKPELKTCRYCKHWNNKQAELDYTKHYGICTCSKWSFDIRNSGDCMVLDRGNKGDKHMGTQRFENQASEIPIGKTRVSRYCLVTEEEFGCVYHQSNV